MAGRSSPGDCYQARAGVASALGAKHLSLPAFLFSAVRSIAISLSLIGSARLLIAMAFSA